MDNKKKESVCLEMHSLEVKGNGKNEHRLCKKLITFYEKDAWFSSFESKISQLL